MTSPHYSAAALRSLTPSQQVTLLSEIASIVMDRQSALTLTTPVGEGRSTKTLLLAEVSTPYTPAPDDHELQALNRLAADPRNSMVLTDAVLDRMADEVPRAVQS